MKPVRNITPEEALSRLQNLCSAREKCTGDVLDKLKQWNIPEEEHKKILASLIKDKFIDDHRFAGFFVRDKQRINKWGREKIRFALVSKNLAKEIIEEALSGLPAENYETALRELLSRKSRELSRFEGYEKRNRLVHFAIQRGFDYDLILRLVDEYVRD